MKFLHRTWAEIDADALIHNFNIIKQDVGSSKIMAVVKADAYGHSANYIAPLLQENGASYFAVSNIEEAITLRGCGITKPILILGYTPVNMVSQLYLNDIIQAVFSPEYARDLSEAAVNAGVTIKIHIKLDTGMGRIGFDCRDEELCGINEAIKAAGLEGFDFGGVFTHFALSDRSPEEEDGYTDAQFKRFVSAIEKFKAAGKEPPIKHCCNSAAVCLDNKKHLDICRPGIILYGLTPSSSLKLKEDFIPVMTLKSVVSMVKEIKPGDSVNYGRTFIADKKMRVATITAGYADGYPRLLSNRGYVIINGKKAPIIGRICMDQMSVDVSEIENVSQGDEVILFGKELPVEELAEICGTINYEIVCGISPRVPRIFIKKR
ncbi:MAG: alanine racemase [Clostridia bacterium]|nr:alanine racemase [Clostridia bacterium]